MPVLEYTKDEYWKLVQPYERAGVTVPEGFITDLASTPRFLWIIWPPEGNYIAGAIVHDYLYYRRADRAMADRTLLTILLEDNVGKVTSYCFYIAVRAFGWRGYYQITNKLLTWISKNKY